MTTVYSKRFKATAPVRTYRWLPQLLHVAYVFILLGIHHVEALAAPIPVLADPVARMEYGSSKGQPTLQLRVDGLDQQGMSDKLLLSAVNDQPKPGELLKVQGNLTFKELAPSAASRSWLLVLNVDNVPPNTSQRRWLTVTLSAGREVTFPYTLTNMSNEKFSWTVRALPAHKLGEAGLIPISIAVGTIPATNVRVLQSAMVERVTKVPLAAKGLELCDVASSPCPTGSIDLKPNSANQLWLSGADGAGTYDGTVTVSALEKPEGDSVSMTLFVSGPWLKTLGVLTILVGVIITYAATSLLRSMIYRRQLLLPVGMLGQNLKKLTTEISGPSSSHLLEATNKRLCDLEQRLTDTMLEENGLPSLTPQLPSASTQESIEQYRNYLQQISDWIQCLAFVLNAGIKPAWSAYQDEAQRDGARAWLAAIDSFVASQAMPPSAELLRTELDRIAAENQPKRNLMREDLGQRIQSPATQYRTTQELQLSIHRLSFGGWLFVVLATTLGGAYIFVLGPSSMGFGTSVDFFQCLLWGMGLPTGVQMLQSSQSSISSIFGLAKL